MSLISNTAWVDHPEDETKMVSPYVESKLPILTTEEINEVVKKQLEEKETQKWVLPTFNGSKWISATGKEIKNNLFHSKYMVFTYYGPNEPNWDEKTMNFLCYQQEKCPKTGRRHWQGYVELKEKMRLYAFIEASKMPGVWLDTRKGTTEQAIAYCDKAKTAVSGTHKKFGKIASKGQGHRSDLTEIAKKIEGGASMKEIARTYPSDYIRYHRGLETFRDTLEEIKVPMPKIKPYGWQNYLLKELDKPVEPPGEGPRKRNAWWIWSHKSGTGKTTFQQLIQATYGPDNVAIGCLKWEDFLYAYDKQKIILFNFPRAQEFHDTLITCLEHATDGGMQFSRKYTSKCKILNARVLVFANKPCPEDKIPLRFKSICLDDPDPMQDRNEETEHVSYYARDLADTTAP